MVWDDILIGVVVAAAITVFVPQSFWQSLFSSSGTVETLLLYSLIGTLIGVITFSCSI